MLELQATLEGHGSEFDITPLIDFNNEKELRDHLNYLLESDTYGNGLRLDIISKSEKMRKIMNCGYNHLFENFSLRKNNVDAVIADLSEHIEDNKVLNQFDDWLVFTLFIDDCAKCYGTLLDHLQETIDAVSKL